LINPHCRVIVVALAALPMHPPAGAPSQAWSVTCVLDAWWRASPHGAFCRWPAKLPAFPVEQGISLISPDNGRFDGANNAPNQALAGQFP